MPLTRRQFLKISAGVLAALGIGDAGKELFAGEASETHQEAGLAKSLAENVASFPKAITSPSGRVSKLDRTRLLLFFTKPIERKTIEGLISNAGAVLEDSPIKGGGQASASLPNVTHSPRRFWIRWPAGQNFNQQIVDALIQSLPPTLNRIGAVYQLPAKKGLQGLFSPMPDVLIIKTVPNVDEASLSKVLSHFDLAEVPRKSKVGAGYRYFILRDPTRQTVYALPRMLLDKYKKLIAEVHFERLQLLSPAAYTPNDPLYQPNGANEGQWNLKQGNGGISAELAWDVLNLAANPVVVCVIDEGCDLNHEDLKSVYTSDSITIGDYPDLPQGQAPSSVSHGTHCAGVIAAVQNNNIGVAGLAKCQIMSVRADPFAFEIALAIEHAVTKSAKVISYSYAYNWKESNPDDAADITIVTDAIHKALQAGLVFCAAAGNDGNSAVSYPASYKGFPGEGLIACGASNQSDERCNASDWALGSNWGSAISVVAPGVKIPTTSNSGYIQNFQKTSAATPHVAGLAALLMGRYSTLSNTQVRSIIERTADKINQKTNTNPNGYDYQERMIGFPFAPFGMQLNVEEMTLYRLIYKVHTNGTWCQDVGYGRINAYHAMDFADVMIKDYPNDKGSEPSHPPTGNIGDQSDIVIRPTDDGIFDPLDFNESSVLRRGQTNYLYVRVTNLGPATARNVNVLASFAIDADPNFLFPGDWTTAPLLFEVATLVPNSFSSSIAPDQTTIAKFTITSLQVEHLWSAFLQSSAVSSEYTISVIAWTFATNDFAYDKANHTGADLIARRNNLAQRYLSIT